MSTSKKKGGSKSPFVGGPGTSFLESIKSVQAVRTKNAIISRWRVGIVDKKKLKRKRHIRGSSEPLAMSWTTIGQPGAKTRSEDPKPRETRH